MNRLVALVALLALVLGLLSGILLDRQVLAASPPVDNLPPNAAPAFKLIAEAWNIVDQAYVDRSALQPPRLARGAVAGLVDALGDTGHSRYQSPEMARRERDLLQGQFEGIGVELQMSDGRLVVVTALDGSPAQQAGLRPGPLLQGPPGTSVTLTILDPATGQTREVAVKRARIPLQNVTWQRLPGHSIAHVRVAAFSQGVGQQLRAALEEIQKQGLTGAVLDLRDDPGGLVAEAVVVASQFLRSGNVYLAKNAQGQVTPVPVQPGGVALSIPLVVLVNGGTASSAEIVAGALQDARRATLVGETTVGTGTVLKPFPLSDGSVLLLATEEWLTPSGRTIWHRGITPDVAVALPAGVAPLLPKQDQSLTPEQLRASQDVQLKRALEVLAQPR
jgi:carboxyl-terminal processing protease